MIVKEENMKRSKRAQIPKKFKTLKEAGEFWDTHSAADYWNQMEDVDMDVDIESRRFVVLLDGVTYRAARQRAKDERISPDEFVTRVLSKVLSNVTHK
jgi:hypothetical protein